MSKASLFSTPEIGPRRVRVFGVYMNKAKTCDDWKFFIKFTDKIRAVNSLFEYSVGGLFESKLPMIMGRVHDIRCDSAKVRAIYGNVDGVWACLQALDCALYEVERLAFCVQVERSRKDACKFQMQRAWAGFAEVWCNEHQGVRERQATLADKT